MDERDEGIEVTLRMNGGQARALVMALDAYNRLCMGQLEEVERLVRQGVIPLRREQGAPRETADMDACDGIRELSKAMKAELGYAHVGHNGIGHRHVHVSGRRAYEMQKAVSQALAYHANPNPAHLGIDYDGVIVRYTTDPKPVAEVAGAAKSLTLSPDR